MPLENEAPGLILNAGGLTAYGEPHMRRLSNWTAKRAGNYITVYAAGDEGEDVRVTKVIEMSPGSTSEGLPCVMAFALTDGKGGVEQVILLIDSQPANDQVDDSPDQAERD